MQLHPILSALLRNKTGAVLVAIQVAISLGILSNALHLVQQRLVIAARPSGIADEADVFSLFVNKVGGVSPADKRAAQQREADLLHAVPGVVSVAKISQTPMSGSVNTGEVNANPNQVTRSARAALYFSPDALIKTWGMKLVEGREFLPDDVIEVNESVAHERAPGVIITQALAKKIWPEAKTVLGKQIYFGVGETARSARVIGVVERLQSQRAEAGQSAEYAVLSPTRFIGSSNNMYTIRTKPGQRDRVMKEAEAVLRAASPYPVILNTKSVLDDRKDRYRIDIAISWTLIVISILLLIVTASGIVGIASLWVEQRRKQIGVRRALGARRVDVMRYFITENFLITSMGVVVGVVLAVALNQLLVSALELVRLPVGYLIAGAAVFWTLGVIAVYGPAWRAASISPAIATRTA